jgi:HEAT repeat protein
VEQLARWLDAINRPTFDDDSCRDRAIAEMRAAEVDMVFPLLADPLKDADPEIRCDAITALLFLDAAPAVELVVAMLKDPETIVRLHTCERLYGFGDERAVPALSELLRRDPDPQVRGEAAYALGGIGNPAAIPHLLAVLGTDNEHDIQGHSPSSCAATALDEILGTHETRIHLGGGLCRMADHKPDFNRLRKLAEALFQKWSDDRADVIA